MLKYNHAFTLGFSVDTYKEDSTQLTSDELIAALKSRIKDLEENDEVEEAVGMPFDSYVYEDDE